MPTGWWAEICTDAPTGGLWADRAETGVTSTCPEHQGLLAATRSWEAQGGSCARARGQCNLAPRCLPSAVWTICLCCSKPSGSAALSPSPRWHVPGPSTGSLSSNMSRPISAPSVQVYAEGPLPPSKPPLCTFPHLPIAAASARVCLSPASRSTFCAPDSNTYHVRP